MNTSINKLKNTQAKWRHLNSQRLIKNKKQLQEIGQQITVEKTINKKYYIA